MSDKDIARLHKFLHTMALSIVEDFHAVRKSILALDKRMDDGFKRVDARFDVVEGKIERLARNLDEEVERRQRLGDRLSKVETKLKI
jgi:hypothetical protein